MNPEKKVPVARKDFMKTAIETSFGSAPFRDCYSAAHTLHHVDFFCNAPKAGHVFLVGDFNDWDPSVTPMRRMPDGRWMASLELHHGHHQYLFLIDGASQLDPKANGIARNDKNERVSLVAVS